MNKNQDNSNMMGIYKKKKSKYSDPNNSFSGL